MILHNPRVLMSESHFHPNVGRTEGGDDWCLGPSSALCPDPTVVLSQEVSETPRYELLSVNCPKQKGTGSSSSLHLSTRGHPLANSAGAHRVRSSGLELALCCLPPERVEWGKLREGSEDKQACLNAGELTWLPKIKEILVCLEPNLWSSKFYICNFEIWYNYLHFTNEEKKTLRFKKVKYFAWVHILINNSAWNKAC